MQESHVVVVVDSPEFNPELKVKGLISDFFLLDMEVPSTFLSILALWIFFM